MVDTVRTWPALITQWQDAGAVGRLTPQTMRDLIVSIPVDHGFGAYTGQAYPALRGGVVNLSLYPGVTMGAGQVLATRQATATAIQAALNYCATNKYAIYVPAGVYEIDVAAGLLMTDTTIFDQFTWMGTINSQIVQFHTNSPILTIGDVSSNNALLLGGLVINGMQLNYGVSQAGQTAANALTLGRICFSEFANIKICLAQTVNPPYIALRIWTANNAFFFSNLVRNVFISGAQQSLFSQESTGTGCNFQNMYMNAQTVGGNTAGAVALPFNMNCSGNVFDDMHFDRLNIEWCSANVIMNIGGAKNCKFTACHIEGVVLTGASPTMCACSNSDVQFDSGQVLNLGVNTGLFTGTAYLYYGYISGGCSLINQTFYQSSPSQAQNASVTLGLQNGTAPIWDQMVVEIHSAKWYGWDSFPMSMDASTPAATYGNVRVLAGYHYPAVYPMAKKSLIANPATNYILPGCWGAEATVVYDTPIAALTNLALGPNYMLGSDKGSTIKRPVGHQVKVVRTTSCTGNFNITVRDSTTGGTTIGTFTGSASAGTMQTFGWSGTAWAAI